MCDDINTVPFFLDAKSLKTFLKCADPAGSKPIIGSSRINVSGDPINAWATLSL